MERYVYETSKTNEIDRLSTSREKTGVFLGAYAFNPVNGKKIPVYVSDYVLYSYGTGAVMGVPAHDTRDFEFAKKYNLPINRVINSKSKNNELPMTEDGILVNSLDFDGQTSEEARRNIIAYLATKGVAKIKTNYRLRDWLISRQRYWGAPIPVIHCDKCGDVPVPYEDLPVRLPYNVEFKPDGKSPLAKSDEFMHCKCPKCGGDALRDPDTLDTFVCSSCYYLRYPDAKNENAPFNPQIINKMLPVDKYVGGAEHACMHLLYARFVTKALHDMGYLDFDEPFTSLVHQGVILGPDGTRMSKSKGNVVSPDDYIETYGSDVFRLYLMFGFSYTEGGPWDDQGIKAIAKFVGKIETFADKVIMYKDAKYKESDFGSPEKDLLYSVNNYIKQIDRDMNNFSFNTVVARLMEYLTAMQKYDAYENKNTGLLKKVFSEFIQVLAPCAPHISEEFWQKLGNKKSVFLSDYPTFDETKLVKDETEYALQVNSKIKMKLLVPSNLTKEETETFVKNNADVLGLIGDGTIKKIIVVPGRLVNIIV